MTPVLIRRFFCAHRFRTLSLALFLVPATSATCQDTAKVASSTVDPAEKTKYVRHHIGLTDTANKIAEFVTKELKKTAAHKEMA